MEINNMISDDALENVVGGFGVTARKKSDYIRLIHQTKQSLSAAGQNREAAHDMDICKKMDDKAGELGTGRNDREIIIDCIRMANQLIDTNGKSKLTQAGNALLSAL